MPAVRRYAYLHARVSSFAQRLLGEAEVMQMLSVSATPPAAVLERLHLSTEILQDTQLLERLPARLLAEEAGVLIRASIGTGRELLRYWMRRLELINLKALLRAKLSGEPPTATRQDMLDLRPVASLSVEDLLHAETIEELLHRLQSTQWADMAQQAMRSYAERHDLFAAESTLDRQYFAGLARLVARAPAGERSGLDEFFGTYFDQINLVWLLRYRFALGLAPPHTYFLLVPAGRYLGSATLLDLVQRERTEDVLRDLPEPLRARLQSARSVHAVEAHMSWRTEAVARWVLRRRPFTLARAFAYLYLRERQLQHLYIAIRGAALGLDSAAVREAAGLDAVTELDRTG